MTGNNLKKIFSPERLIFLAFILIALVAVTGIEIIRIDVRFALMVQEINRHGIGVFPTINGYPYADYPVTYTLFSWLASLGGRFVNPATLALPTILLGAFSVAWTYRIGERLRHGIGAWAAALLVVSYEFGQLFTGFGIDVPVMAAGVVMADLLTRKTSLKRDLPLFALLLIAVFFIRGPLGIILLGGGTAAWLLGSGRLRELLPFGITGAATTAICVATGYALIWKQGGAELLNVFYEWQITSRVNTPPNHHALYFFADALLSFAPVGIAAAATAIIRFRTLKKDPVWCGILGFALIVLALLTIPACKHLRYMSIALPFLALIAGNGALALPEKWQERALPILTCAVAAVLLILSLLFALPVLKTGAGRLHFILTAIAAVTALLTLKKIHSADGKLFVLAALIFIAEAWVIFPVTAAREYSQRFVDACEKVRNGRRICFFEIGPDHQDNIYVLKMKPEERSKVLLTYAFIFPGKHSENLQKMYRMTTLDAALQQLSPGDLILVEKKCGGELAIQLNKAGVRIEPRLSGKLGRKNTDLYQILSMGEKR